MTSLIRRVGAPLAAVVWVACGQTANVGDPPLVDASTAVQDQLAQDGANARQCAHPICSTGSKLRASCDPCVAKVCSVDWHCCQTSWDAQCVREVTSVCGKSCGSACTGCVDRAGACQTGTSPSACGTGGAACVACASGQSCQNGTCVTGCVPSCGGKQCGSNGCGGSCGTCTNGQTCSSSGTCVSTCTPSCSGKVCGTDGCGGSCGTCAAGQSCDPSGQCSTATCLSNGPGLEAACVHAGGWGSALTTVFGRVDGTLTAIATPSSPQCDQSNATHLILEVSFGGAPYALVVNVQDSRSTTGVFFAEKDAPLVGVPWQAGWHTDAAEKLDYVNNLNEHSTAFASFNETDLVNKIVCELVPGDTVSIYALGFSGLGAHDIHRNTGGGGADGAIVLHANTPNPHYMMFHFVTQTF